MDRTRTALREMAREDPELAARLIIQTLPAAASRIRAPLRYQLTVGDMGTWLVVVDDDGARVQPGMDGDVDFALSTDPAGLAELAAGASPLRLMLGGRVRIRGKRRRAIRLRAMSSANGLSMADALAGGAQLDPDAVYRSLAYMIDPDWTCGHTFAIAYELTGDGGGKWFVHVDDGNRVRVTTEPPDGHVAATTRVSVDTFKRLVSGEISPAQSMREQLADIEGEIYPTVLVGRWIERAQGRDDDELEREGRQRDIQSRRAGSWGGSGNGARPTEVDSAPCGSGRTGGRTRSTSPSTASSGSPPRARRRRTPRGASAPSTSARSGSRPTWPRSSARRRAARWRRSSPPSSWTRRGTPCSSTASGPRSWRSRPTTCAGGCSRCSRSCSRPGSTPSTTGCATWPTASRRSPTTSTCSWRASPSTTWSSRACSPPRASG